MFFAFACIGVEVFLRLLAFRGFGRRLWEACGLQFLDTLEGVGRQSLALGLIALDGDKLFGIDLLRASEGVSPSVGELDAWIDSIREEDEL